jgi:hypothetical protein
MAMAQRQPLPHRPRPLGTHSCRPNWLPSWLRRAASMFEEIGIGNDLALAQEALESPAQ